MLSETSQLTDSAKVGFRNATSILIRCIHTSPTYLPDIGYSSSTMMTRHAA